MGLLDIKENDKEKEEMKWSAFTFLKVGLYHCITLLIVKYKWHHIIVRLDASFNQYVWIFLVLP